MRMHIQYTYTGEISEDRHSQKEGKQQTEAVKPVVGYKRKPSFHIRNKRCNHSSNSNQKTAGK